MHTRYTPREFYLLQGMAEQVREYHESLAKKKDRVEEGSSEEEVSPMPLKLLLSLCVLCPILHCGEFLLRRSCTTLRYEGNTFQCLCGTGSLATLLNAAEFSPSSIPGYAPAQQASASVRDVAGRNVKLIGSAPVTFKVRNRCASVTLYYLSNMPVSVIFGLDTLGRLDIWMHTADKTGDGVTLCNN